MPSHPVTGSGGGVYYHGTPDERSWDSGSARGLHVGTYESARQALEARIGAPAEGEWDGTREYGKTPIVSNAKNTGYHSGLSWQDKGEPKHEHATYSSGHSVPLEARPGIFPVRITGEMTNHPAAPMSDMQANSRMKSQITRGNARRGYFYENVAEDPGSVSAVVPSAAHLERVHPPKEAASATRTAAEIRPLPVEEGLYYRTHHKDAPFSRENAQTRTIGEPPSPGMAKYWEPKPGYSSFWHPHHLHQYHEEMSWDSPQEMKGRRVLAFRGTPVGSGADGEPAVMPHSDKPEASMSWGTFKKRLSVTPEPGTRWDDHTWGEGPHGQMVDDGYRTIGGQPKTASRWEPASGIFAPTTGMDSRLFDEHGTLRPGVRAAVMEKLDRCLRSDTGIAGSDWQSWLRVWLAGGSVSEWAGSRPNDSAQDLDVLVGLSLHAAQGCNAFEGMDHEQAATALNAAFRGCFNDPGWKPNFGGTYDLTAYCNPLVANDVTVIRPYAAWDLTSSAWAVRPPHLPQHSAKDFDPAVTAHAQAVLAEARAVLKMQEPLRTREARDLWEHVHAHRCVAFSPEGSGWDDPGNVDEKMLAYAPHGVLEKIRELATAEMPKTAAAEPRGWWKLYHGTNREFAPGDHVEPGRRRQNSGYTGQDVFASDELKQAKEYAHAASRESGGHPRVYEVEPAGTASPAREQNAWQSSQPMRVKNLAWSHGEGPCGEWGCHIAGPGTVPKTAAAEPMRNTATGGDEWYHGSDHPEQFERFDSSRQRQSHEDGEGSGRWWNSRLGPHFTTEHHVATELSSHMGGGNVYHARLHVQNPAHYPSETGLGRAGYDWAKSAGYRMPFPGHGGDGAFDDALTSHPQSQEIADGFREHLRSQGHDGITYGNEYEGSKGHLSAVSLDPDRQVHITGAHPTYADGHCDQQFSCPHCGDDTERSEPYCASCDREVSEHEGHHEAAAAKTGTRNWDDKPAGGVYLRFGHWPEDERSQNNVTGHREEGVSAYDLGHGGEPKDPDPGMERGHRHDEHCEDDCDLDWENEGYGNDTLEEMQGRVHRAERNRYSGSDRPSETGHLVTGDMVGLGHDAEPLLRNVKRVGDWIDHRHHFIPGAEKHRLAREPGDEGYEKPKLPHRTAARAGRWTDWAKDQPHKAVIDQAQGDFREQHPELTSPLDGTDWSDPDSYFARSRDSSEGTSAMRKILHAAGHPDADRAWVAPHPDPRGSSQVAVDTKTGAPGAVLLDSRYHLATVAHEAAHLVHAHRAGISFADMARGEHAGGQVDSGIPDHVMHGPEFAGHLADALDVLSPGSGDDFRAHHDTAVQRVGNARFRIHGEPRDFGGGMRREASAPDGGSQRPKRTPGNAMVYLDVPHGTVQPHDGQEAGHHVALAYLPRKIDDEAFGKVVDRAREAATRHAPMKATISGGMTFPPGTPSTQRRASAVPVHAPGIRELQSEFGEFDRAHYETYAPHVTRAQLGGHQDDPEPHPEASFPVTHVHVRRGEEVHSFPLTGPSRREAAAGDGSWYHGTRTPLSAGDAVLPASKHGRTGNWGDTSDPDFAHATSSMADAADFGHTFSGRGREEGPVRVFQVKPAGETEVDPKADRTGIRSRDGFHIVREVPEREWRSAMDQKQAEYAELIRKNREARGLPGRVPMPGRKTGAIPAGRDELSRHLDEMHGWYVHPGHDLEHEHAWDHRQGGVMKPHEHAPGETDHPLADVEPPTHTEVLRSQRSGPRDMAVSEVMKLKSGDWDGRVGDHLDDIRDKTATGYEDGGEGLRSQMEAGRLPGGPLVVNHGQLDDGHRRLLMAHELGWPSVQVRSGDWGHREASSATGLEGTDYEGETGSRDHITRTEHGTIPTSAVARMPGARGEVPGEHASRQGQAWEDFKRDIAENGIRNPLFVTVDHGQEPKISEGNHRRDAAVELGLPSVPAEIRYFGHAEQQGTVAGRMQREAVSGYDGLTGRSAMIYLDLPPGAVRPVPGGTDEHHVTLAYLGKNVSDKAFEEACRRTRAAAAKYPPMDGVLNGIDIFPPSKSSDGKVVAFVPAFVGGIGALRRDLEDLSASEHRDYRPHVTLAYLEEGDSLPAPHPAVPLRFGRVHVQRGDQVVSFPLTGEHRREGGTDDPV